MPRTAVQIQLNTAAMRISTLPSMFNASGPMRVRVNPAEVTRTFRSLANIHLFMTEVVGKVEPEFGADMPYSSLLEEARHPNHIPHIAPAISGNATFIRRRLQNGLSDLAIRYSRSGTLNTSGAKKEVETLWEDILNSKPRADARAKAPELFGFHKMTIGGHGKKRTDAEIMAIQHKLTTERNLVRKSLGKERAGLG